MDSERETQQTTGENVSTERVSFWAVVGCYLFRFLAFGVGLVICLDIDSVADLATWDMFFKALPLLCVVGIPILWHFFSDCYGRYQRGYFVRNKWSPPRKWYWEIVMWTGWLLFSLFLSFAAEKYAKTGKETIGGVTWRYKIVGGNAVIERKIPQFCAAISVSTSGELTIPSSLGGHPVRGIGEYAFYKCSKLTSVVIPKSVTNIERCAFEECGGLKSIEIPESVKTLGYSAFGSCSRLTTVKLRGKFCPTWGAPFISCRALTAFEVDPDNERCKVVDGMLLSKDGTCLWVGVNGDVEIPNGVTKIGYKAFSGRELKSVAMPRTVTDIGEAAFENCRELKSVVLPEGVNGIGAWAFNGCRGLTSVVLPESVKIIGNDAFRGCSNLASIVVPSNVVHIMQSAFAETPFFDNKPEGLVVLSGIAYRWKGKRPDVLIPDGVTRIIENAFENRYDFKSVAVADSVTNVGYAAFRGCAGLTSVALGDSVASIGNDAFCACFKLSSVSIPRSLTCVGQDAFRGCPIKTVYVEKGDAVRVKKLLLGKGIDVDKVEFVEREAAPQAQAAPDSANGVAK